MQWNKAAGVLSVAVAAAAAAAAVVCDDVLV